NMRGVTSAAEYRCGRTYIVLGMRALDQQHYDAREPQATTHAGTRSRWAAESADRRGWPGGDRGVGRWAGDHRRVWHAAVHHQAQGCACRLLVDWLVVDSQSGRRAPRWTS